MENKKQSTVRRGLAVLLALGMTASGMVHGIPALASEAGGEGSAVYDADYCYQEGYNVDVNIGAEGSVLLKNENSVLPLAEGTKVTLLGAMSYNYVEGGTGSAGGKDDENTVMMNDAFTEAGLDVNSEGWNWLADQCGGSRGVDASDPEAVGWTSYTAIHEFDTKVYESGKSSLLASGYTDYAIVTFSRSGAEGASPSMDYDGDGSTLTGSTYLELDDDEKDLLTFCAANYAHTIVLVNSASPMELGFLESDEYNVEACLWIGHPGEAGIVGSGTILTGRTNPSGRLVDTYAYDMTTNPTYYNTDDNRYTNGQTFYQYEEGIYVGYRYYETADSAGYFDSSEFTSLAFKNGAVSGYDKVVQFPFGYGLSYTTFSEEIADSDVKLTAHGTNSVQVKVTNTGSTAGKNVVELYMEAPYQSDTDHFGIKGKGLEKAKVILIGYAKTSELAPGASETVTIEFGTDDLASYDNFGQGYYVLEQGEYRFRVQKDAHQWGDAGTDNACSDSVSAKLSKSVIYDESGSIDGAEYAGARDSDKIIAKNALDDVTAGDGNMLDGYLSRSDIAGGMKEIMKHTSNEEANEVLKDTIEAALAVKGTDAYSYEYETYQNGVKTKLTSTIYANGNNMMPFSETTPDGKDVTALTAVKWDQTYYVIESSDGTNALDSDGLPQVVDAEPTSGAYHKLGCDDMENVPIDTEAGLAIWTKLAEQASVSEAIELQGNSGWQINGIDSVGMGTQKTVDGPGEPANGTAAGATWFPSAVLIASTWNDELAYAEGTAYGNQCVLFGVGCAYAPAMNMHRSPFGGRNFEYYSEDGFLSGNIGGNAVAGIQSTGTGVFIKHFALNDGDTNRGGNTTWANEQAIREIYLRTYEIACKDYGANGIMGSLNRVGMSWFHYGMYVTMLRDEWGFEGYLITDGDGSDGDVYNSAQAMLSVEGSMLARGIYVNAPSTVAAYGEASDSAYGQYALQQVLLHRLYQYAGSGSISAATSEGSTDGTIPVGIIIGAAAGVVVAAAVVIAAVAVGKKKKKGGKKA